MLQNMIIPTSGGEEKKNIYIRATDRSTSPYQSTGEYEIGTIVISDSASYGFVGILLKEPMNLYVEEIHQLQESYMKTEVLSV